MLLQIFKAILFTSVVGGTLAVILLLLKPITKRCFGSTWQYYAWAIVLIVMISPVTIELPQSSTPVAPVSQILQTPETEAAIQQEKQPLQNEPLQIANYAPFYNTLHTAKNISLGITDMFSYVWLIGCIIFLTLTIFRYLIFLQAIRKNSTIMSCPELGINKIITRKTDMIDAPLMVGLFRPTLLLPDYEMTAESLKFILLHELTHYRRRDLLYKWFSMFVCTVHWFNPLVYIVLKQIDEECEISCDLSVVGDMERQEQKEYMHTILTLITQTGTKQKLFTTAMASNKKQIKRRFIMIKTMQKMKKSTVIISAITACMLLATTIFASGILSNIIGNESQLNSNKTENKNHLQNTVMAAYSHFNDATFIFMNPSTGEILACAGDIDRQIEPAFAFKYISLSMLLNENLTSLEDTFECTGKIIYGNNHIACRDHEGHGKMKLMDAVNASCNVAILQAAEGFDKNRLYAYMERLGIANSINANFHQQSTFGDMEARIALMGQGFTMKPLQLLLEYSALVNGGKIPKVYIDETSTHIKNYDIKDYVTDEDVSVITPKTSEQILKTMNQNDNDNDIFTFGGTADILPREIPRYVHTAIAMAPANNPQIIGIAFIPSSEKTETLQETMRNILNDYYN